MLAAVLSSAFGSCLEISMIQMFSINPLQEQSWPRSASLLRELVFDSRPKFKFRNQYGPLPLNTASLSSESNSVRFQIQSIPFLGAARRVLMSTHALLHSCIWSWNHCKAKGLTDFDLARTYGKIHCHLTRERTLQLDRERCRRLGFQTTREATAPVRVQT
jgi:hypothetical protein